MHVDRAGPIPPPFDWSQQLKYNWTSVEGQLLLRDTARPSLKFDPNPYQLDCPGRILNGQDVLCLSATGTGKSALIYITILGRRGVIMIVISPTNFLEVDMVRDNIFSLFTRLLIVVSYTDQKYGG